MMLTTLAIGILIGGAVVWLLINAHSTIRREREAGARLDAAQEQQRLYECELERWNSDRQK